jgi:hypothetical protein
MRGNSSRRQLSIVRSLVAFRFLARGLHVQVVLVRFLQCSAHAAIRQTIVRVEFCHQIFIFSIETGPPCRYYPV